MVTRLVMLMVLVLWAIPVSATDWYVATTGTDNAGCGATSAECATINYVIINKVADGDTIKVKAGTYTNQGTVITLNGEDNITITADNIADRPQIHNTKVKIWGPSNGTTISYMRIRAAATPYAAFEGVITIIGFPTVIDDNELWNGANGLLVRTGREVTISDNDIHDCGVPLSSSDEDGIQIINYQGAPDKATDYSNGILITRNLIHECSGDGIMEASMSEAGNDFQFLTVSYNTIYNNDEQGLDTKGTDDYRIIGNTIYGNERGGLSNNYSAGLCTQPCTTNRWEVRDNIFRDHVRFAIFNQGGGSEWQVYNNIIYNNVTNPPANYCAVKIPSDGGSVFYNNTVYNNTDTTGTTVTCGIMTMTGGARIINNIFYNNGTGANDHGNIRNYLGEDSGTPSYNYVYPTTCGTGSCQTGTNAVTSCYTSGNCAGFTNISPVSLGLTDTNVHTEPTLPTLPAAGGTMTDTTFGTEILRVTDSNDGTNCYVEYSYWPTFNYNSTYVKALCVISGTNRTKIWPFDPVTFTRGTALTLMPMGAGQSTDPIWSHSSATLLYAYGQDGDLRSYDVVSEVTTVIKDFTSVLPASGQLQQMSISDDDDIFAWHTTNSSGSPVGYLVWKRSTNTYLLQQTESSLDEVQIDKSGRWLNVNYTTGNAKIWDLLPGTPTSVSLTWGTNGFFHRDSGHSTLLTYNGAGNAFAYRSLAAPTVLTTLLTPTTVANRTAHFSMRANDETWGVISHYNDLGTGVSNAFDNEIFQVATNGSGQVQRFAHHRSVFNDYFDAPFANISPDGKFIAFSSNWGSASGRRDLFIVKISGTTQGDYTILTGSPAKDAGTTLASPYNVDAVGSARPSGTAFDLGAYEFGGGAPDPPPPPPGVSIYTIRIIRRLYR